MCQHTPSAQAHSQTLLLSNENPPPLTRLPYQWKLSDEQVDRMRPESNSWPDFIPATLK